MERKLVLPHRYLGVDFFHEIEDDGNNDEDGSSAERKRGDAR